MRIYLLLLFVYLFWYFACFVSFRFDLAIQSMIFLRVIYTRNHWLLPPLRTSDKNRAHAHTHKLYLLTGHQFTNCMHVCLLAPRIFLLFFRLRFEFEFEQPRWLRRAATYNMVSNLYALLFVWSISRDWNDLFILQDFDLWYAEPATGSFNFRRERWMMMVIRGSDVW